MRRNAHQENFRAAVNLVAADWQDDPESLHRFIHVHLEAYSVLMEARYSALVVSRALCDSKKDTN